MSILYLPAVNIFYRLPITSEASRNPAAEGIPPATELWQSEGCFNPKPRELPVLALSPAGDRLVGTVAAQSHTFAIFARHLSIRSPTRPRNNAILCVN